ncbi:uncharacterized protein LOC126739346 [Anthonomus grandis grandis]|uniref:uncharacterized protein LOC126739346 n=1 Tax=Anthonomus grandis grandis TaxID=2921223 RepID=UPI0021654B98|nr:uncharacterized protein LOC126739346 [Anthonomus grandis grandis]
MEGEDTNHTFQRRLVEVVRETPQIWDRSCPLFRIKQAKEKAWAEIADRMAISVNTCKDTFKSLREKYLRERDKAQQNQYCRWELLEDLKFLDPHIVTRSSTGPTSFTNGDFSEDEQSLNSENDPLEFDRQLIRMVKKANAIWDRNSNIYPNRGSKTQLWGNISAVLHKDPNSCMLRWKALREKYIRQKAKFHEGEGKWELLDDLSFLDRVIQYRRKQSELYPQLPGSSNSYSYIHCNLDEDNDHSYTDTSNDFIAMVKEESTTVQQMADSSYGSKRSRAVSTESYGEEKRVRMEGPANAQGAKTPEQLFGDLVASLLMKKPESERNMYMIQVMTVLSK